MNRKPVPNPCPECGKLMVQLNRSTVSCTSCSWQETASQEGASDSAGQSQPEELVGVGD
jgi:uncharacterized Zn finger protein (UPF0148 family)